MVMPRLLIVENERIIARDLAQRLTKLGYTVVAIVGSGREAVQQAGDLRPDLVLMDIGLPGEMDGLEAATHVQAQVNIPIIYLTGSREAERSHPHGRAELSLTIQKPVSEQTLQQTIQLARATISRAPPGDGAPRGDSAGIPAFTPGTPEGGHRGERLRP
jgi:CheY-like chemotaxis protein